MSEVPYLISDCSRLYKEIIRSLFESISGPRNVDNGVDDQVGNMQSLRSKVTCD